MSQLNIVFREKVIVEDVDVVEDIIISAGLFNEQEIVIARELVEERLERGTQSGYYFLFAQHHDNILGYSCYGPIVGTDNRFEIHWIAVYAIFQRMGIGRMILEATEEKIRTANGLRIYIETSSRKEYLPTRTFYTHNGYHSAGRIRDFYAAGDDKVIYLKSLEKDGATES